MVSTLAKINGTQVSATTEPVNIQARESFIKEQLNSKPEQIEEKDGVETVPISFLENDLDEVYLGLWKTENFRFQVIANEIVGTIDLHVFDPQAKVWLVRSGSAAVLIRQKKDSEITDISAKIKNGLMMDFPKLETMCIKAAAKRLGKRFGRDLNRKFEDEYEMRYTTEIEVDEVRADVEAKFNNCTTKEQLASVWASYPNLHNNPRFKKLFSSKKAQLSFK
jgi:hypothetical protein